ncbi:hybrid sensor histidine kinase/response regulator [Roseibacillus persicicus]|uniref:histidine kinase n=1 Tax=Roseibacillus persicicus TaxID=454148 RepID=A0A918TXI6_9BACT|nr:ATP-binding protein [Roseibacillus persicicus]GHC65452.1 hypothetical protein GCM10007100_36530 [Roseibacillus persicicus]
MNRTVQAFTGLSKEPIEIEASKIAEGHFRHLAESLPQIVWTAEPDGVLDYISPQMARYTGISEDHPEYLNWAPLIHPEDLDRVNENWQKSLETGRVHEQEFRIRSESGCYSWFIGRAVPFRGAEGKIVKWYGTTTNIDHLRRAAEEKDRFIAILGHELRNPLSAISNSFQALSSGALEEREVKKTFSVLGRQISHLTRLVEDTLDVSRLSSGNFKLLKERLELNQIAIDCVRDFQSRGVKAGTQVSLNTASERIWVDGDAVRISQCLSNLLNNAVKFTPKEAAIEVRLGVDPTGGTAFIEVEDNGVGLGAEEIGSVFEAFHQGACADQLSRDGLGLGLTVVREITSLHGGSVGARSNGLGKGAVFTIRFPVAEAPEKHQEEETIEVKKKETAKILLIEDDEDVATTLKLLLQACGHEVEVAPDAGSAFIQLDAQLPDIIFCDLSLSGHLEGWDIASRIREKISSEQLPYLVALSGHAQSAHIRKSLEVGFKEHLAKPASLAQLQSAVSKALGA